LLRERPMSLTRRACGSGGLAAGMTVRWPGASGTPADP
jgi:hypothetical protein